MPSCQSHCGAIVQFFRFPCPCPHPHSDLARLRYSHGCPSPSHSVPSWKLLSRTQPPARSTMGRLRERKGHERWQSPFIAQRLKSSSTPAPTMEAVSPDSAFRYSTRRERPSPVRAPVLCWSVRHGATSVLSTPSTGWTGDAHLSQPSERHG